MFLIDAHLVLLPALLFLAAVFAAAEASLFSLQRSQLESLKESRPQTYQKIRKLIFEPDELLSTIIIGNECLNIMIATFVVALIENYLPLGEAQVGILSVVVSSVLLLAFSEILPKVLAFRLPVLVASILVWPTSWAHTLFTPVRNLFLVISERALKWIGIEPTPPPIVNELDFLTLVEVGAESGSLEKEEKERIINVFHFSDLTVSQVMTPWSKVFCLSDDMKLDEVLGEVRRKVYSRIPVISHLDQHVVGVLYTKELLKLLLRPHSIPANSLAEAMSPPYVVSSHKKTSTLFREFKVKKVHMALVVDEYGRHVGIVTLEDMLNALFQTPKKREEVAP